MKDDIIKIIDVQILIHNATTPSIQLFKIHLQFIDQNDAYLQRKHKINMLNCKIIKNNLYHT